MLNKYLRLLRVHHYVKNILVLAAAACSGHLMEREKLIPSLVGFAVFCMACSAVYIINDIHDIDKDKHHPTKCRRPLASGEVSVRKAVFLAIVLMLSAMTLSIFASGLASVILPATYVIINIAYSSCLKNIPILDIVVLVSGFVIRLFYGAFMTSTEISHWLYLCVMAMAFYLALGKRRNELRMHVNSREVLNFYTESFLDKNMYVCLALANVFYALWSVDDKTAVHYNSHYMVLTVPIVLIITMKYSLDVEKASSGDPAEVLFADKMLALMCTVYLAVMFALLYS